MIFLNENMSCKMTEILENEKLALKNSINIFNTKKETLLIYMKKLTDSIQKIQYTNNAQILLNLLCELKELLLMMKSLNCSFKSINKQLENLFNIDKNNLSNLVNEYNNNINTLNSDMTSFCIKSEKFMCTVLEHFEFTFIYSNLQEEKSNILPDVIEEIPNEDTNTSSQNTLQDNLVLIISEKDNKVFLPYLIEDLQEQLENSSNAFSSINELIQKEYILPLDRFKNPVLSRFRETYNLMKTKENAPFLEAIDLALELSFNSTLNPAVIAACKNQDQLDIYLDCLENNELDKFMFFNIEYRITPVE